MIRIVRLCLSVALMLLILENPVRGGAVLVAGSPSCVAVRADPSRAAQVNGVLRRVALPVEVELPEAIDPQVYLTAACGESTGTEFTVANGRRNGEKVTLLRYAPCLRQKGNVTTVVETGDSLERIAVRLGLHASASRTLSIVSSRGGVRTSNVKEAKLQIGDKVIAPGVPDWTTFSLNVAEARDRADLVSQLAAVLGCGAEAADECLVRLGVLVLNGVCDPSPGALDSTDQVTPMAASPSPSAGVPSLTPAPPTSLDSVNILQRSVQQVFSARREVEETTTTAATEPDVGPSDQTPFPTPTGTVGAEETLGSAASVTLQNSPPPSSTLPLPPVAAEQWPLDRARVTLALNAFVSRASTAVVGVADGGLATSDGSPIPAVLWQVNSGEPTPLTHTDPDDNHYVDDRYGAGVRRNASDLIGSGDISLCDANIDLAISLKPTPRAWASHGSVVSSIATGRWLSESNPSLAPVLPRLVFFRMLRRFCTDNDALTSGSKDANEAIEYLQQRNVKIINMSSLGSGEEDSRLFSLRLKQLLEYGPDLLVVLPAGNSGEDFDATRACPPCLILEYPASDKRLLFVGSASSDLRKLKDSGYGQTTVKLFAPGTPSGAIDLQGADARQFDPSTSFAAPWATLGAAVLQSLGVASDLQKIRERLLISTWPIYDVNAEGVLDLTKVSAARQYAIEVIEPQSAGVPNSGLVRRTYVGTLLDDLKTLKICPNVLQKEGVEGVRIDWPADANGWRRTKVQKRLFDPLTSKRKTTELLCQPTGSLRFRDLKEGELTFPLASITQILLPVELQ